MNLVSNWRRVLHHAWSIRLIIGAGLLSGAEAALPLVQEVLPVPRGWLAAGSLAVTFAAFVSRFVAQQSVSGGRDADQ